MLARIARELGGRSMDEWAAALTAEELFEWAHLFEEEDKRHKKDLEAAKSKRRK